MKIRSIILNNNPIIIRFGLKNIAYNILEMNKVY